MNRRQFICSSTALLCLPYLPSEEEEVIYWVAETIPDSDAVWLHATMRAMEGTVMKAMSISPRLMTGLEFVEAGNLIEFT